MENRKQFANFVIWFARSAISRPLNLASGFGVSRKLAGWLVSNAASHLALNSEKRMELRHYQQETIDRARFCFRQGHQRVLLVSPTGSGKSLMFSFITKSAVERGLRVMILAHRSEILDQISRTLADVGVEHGEIRAGISCDQSKAVTVASVQTLCRRLDRVTPPDLVVVDEAHHSCAGQWVSVFAAFDKAKFLGVTATPERLDGKGLGDFYSVLVEGPSVEWLIQNRYLATPVYYAPQQSVDVNKTKKIAGDFSKKEIGNLMDKPSITGDAVSHYLKLANGRTAVAFCVNLDHAAHVAAQFNAAGIPSAVIDGTLSRDDRRQRVSDLSNRNLMVLTSCDLVSEGFDLPSVGAAILLRPTLSLSLHLQQIGRALRPAPGKSDALILDHAGNCLRHGLAEEIREWSLEGHVAKKRKKDAVIETKQCATCFAIFSGQLCPQCGTERETKQREIEHVDGQLAVVTAEQIAKARALRAEERGCNSLADFMRIGKQRGYKPGWAYFRWSKSWKNKTRELVPA